jgi:hypothetical protein
VRTIASSLSWASASACREVGSPTNASSIFTRFMGHLHATVLVADA